MTPSAADGTATGAPDWFHRNLAALPDEGVTVVDGCPIRWRRWGHPASPPLVLVHGAAASSRWWASLAPFLAGTWCVVAPDLSGMGDSGWRGDGYRLEQWADEVLACTADATGTGRATIVGHSLGGAVTAVAAVRHGGALTGIVLCDTGVSLSASTGRDSRHYRNRITYRSKAEAIARFKLVPRQDCSNAWMVADLAAASVRPVGAGGVEDRTPPPPGTESAWAWKFDWRLFARSSDRPVHEYVRDVGRGRLAVACLAGERSRVVSPDMADRMTTLLGRGRTVWVPEAAHHLMLDQPIAFVAALRAVLASM